MGDHTDVHGQTSSVVDYSSVQKIKPPRLLCALSLGALYAVVVALTSMTDRFRRLWAELDLKELPIPSEWVVAFSRFLQTPVGLALAAFSFVVVLLLVLRGTFDRFLRFLVGLNLVAIVIVVVVYAFSMIGPLMGLREQAK